MEYQIEPKVKDTRTALMPRRSMQSVDKAMQLLIRYGCMHLQTALQFLRPIIIDLSVGRFSVAATYERESKRDQNYAISFDKKPRVQTRETFRNEDNSW